MELSALVAFLGVSMMLVLLPGPDWAFVVAVGSSERNVVPAVAGLVVGYVLITLVVAAGVAPLVAAAPAALVVLTVAGATYLIYLGVGALRRPQGIDHPTRLGATATPGVGRFVRRGIGVSALNPKAMLFFLVFLPQFARPAAPWPLGVQLAVLGGLWAAIGACFYTALGYTAQRTFGARPSLGRVVTRVAGAAMVVAGVALLIEQFVRGFHPGA